MRHPKLKSLRWLGLGICGIFLFQVILVSRAAPAFVTAFPSGEVSILLDDGLWRKSQETIAFEDIQLDFDCQKDTCSNEVWGYAANFNKADHEGKLLKVIQRGNQIQFLFQMHLNRDKWSQEGEADYLIDLKRNGDKLEGTYTGTHNGRSIQGQAWGIIQNQLKALPNFVPVQPGEHPRLLFRQQDISILRSKAQTPMGRQMVANLVDALATRPDRDFPANDALAYGLLYQLTNNTDYAASAREILTSVMRTPSSNVHGRPKTLLPAAFAYDLIYQTCDRALRQQVNNWFDYNAQILLMGTDRDDFNPTPWSNWNGLYRSALGAIALTLLGEPGNYPPPPIPPIMMRLDAPRHFTSGKGVPINFLESAKMPTAWIFAGPFERDAGEDPLASIGGIQKTQPEVGTTVTYRNSTHTFQPLDPKDIWNHPQYTQGRNMLDLVNPVSGNSNTTAYYYTVVENQQPSWWQVRIRTTYGDGTMYLAGQGLAEGDFVYLEKGRYPVLIEAAIAQRSGWREDSDKIAIEPRFILNDTYLAQRQEQNRKLPLADYSGHVFRENTQDLGIRGIRYFATDYSGASGSPGLFILVDKLMGGEEKVWQMVVAQEHQISILGNSFTITASDGTSLKGTFVAPMNVALSPLESRKIEYRNLRGEAVTETLKLNGIQAKGGDSFFVVMTLQAGVAPKVQVEGQGLDARVKVGEQAIYFSEKINLTK